MTTKEQQEYMRGIKNQDDRRLLETDFELPKGKTCIGCGWLEMENNYRGWCTLPSVYVRCLKGEDEK